MSVWDSLVGQKPVIDMLSRIAQGDPSQITQSWLIWRASRLRPFQYGPSIRGGAGKPRPWHER